jgi:hypothetical protein
MLIAEQLVVVVLTIVLAVGAGLVIVLAEESLLADNEGVERLESVARVLLEFLLDYLVLLA